MHVHLCPCYLNGEAVGLQLHVDGRTPLGTFVWVYRENVRRIGAGVI